MRAQLLLLAVWWSSGSVCGTGLRPRVTSRRGATTRLHLAPTGADFSPNDNNVWQIRRKLARTLLVPVLETTTRRLTRPSNETSAASSLVTKQTKKERAEARKAKREREAKAGVLFSAFFVAAGALVLRIGGRGALLNVLGLDVVSGGSEIRDQIDSFITVFQQHGEFSLPLFFLGWLAAKALCLDFIGVTLALSSGVLFNGVLEGTAASVLASSVASLVVFLVSRYWLREDIVAEIKSRPLLRAVDNAVSKDGFKVCFVLRLSPILPGVPIGAYNYFFGCTSIRAISFYLATALGSIKPYLLDAYLGVFGKTVLDASGADDQGGMQDAVLLVVLGVIVTVGTLATQVAATFYDEIKSEMAAEGGEAPTPVARASNSTSFISRLFSLADGKSTSGPDWLVSAKREFCDATARIDAVVRDELASVAIERASNITQSWSGFDLAQNNATRLALPITLNSEKMDKEKKMNTILSSSPGGIKAYSFPGVRSMAQYEQNGLGEDEISVPALVESTVFSFVLFGILTTLLDEDNFVEEDC